MVFADCYIGTFKTSTSCNRMTHQKESGFKKDEEPKKPTATSSSFRKFESSTKTSAFHLPVFSSTYLPIASCPPARPLPLALHYLLYPIPRPLLPRLRYRSQQLQPPLVPPKCPTSPLGAPCRALDPNPTIPTNHLHFSILFRS